MVDGKIDLGGDDGPAISDHSQDMKRPTKHILAGFLVAAIGFAVVCGALKATLPASTYQVLNAIWLAGVLITWLVWSFQGHYRLRHARSRGGTAARPDAGRAWR